MNIPILIAIIALVIAWRGIRRLNEENLSLYFDKLEADKRTEERNLRVMLLEKKYDKLLGEKVQLETIISDHVKSSNLWREMYESLRAELKRKNRKFGT